MGGGKKNASDSRGMGTSTSTRLTISQAAFAEGASREAFAAVVDRDGCYQGYTGGTKLVVKVFKPKFDAKGLCLTDKDIEMQSYVKMLADTFNKEVGLLKAGEPCNIYMRVAKLGTMQRDVAWRNKPHRQSQIFLLEQAIQGTFQKFNSNSGWSAADPFLDAFSHWTWCHTRDLVVCDLQGVRGEPGEPKFGGQRETYYYLLTDPAINSSTKQFGVNDMGADGIDNFFYKHDCNHICREIGIDRDRLKGRLCLPVVKSSSYSLDSASRCSIPASLLSAIPNPASRVRLGGFELQGGIIEEEDEDSEDEYQRPFSPPPRLSAPSSGQQRGGMMISPSKIFFTHDSISSKFSCNRLIANTYKQLRSREIPLSAIPMMTVTQWNGKWWTFTGNRRLWVFRKLHEEGCLPQIQVNVTQQPIPSKFFTTQNGGVSVRVRDGGMYPNR